MKEFIYVVASLLILAFSAGSSAEIKENESWWKSLRIEPEVMTLNNMEPDDYNIDWVYASLLSHSDIKALIEKDEYQKFIGTSFSFGKVIDLNGNGEDEAIRVGVYRDKNQERGIFLAIFEEGRLVDVLVDSSSQNFSALVLKGNELRWFRCMECSDYTKLLWNGSEYILE